MNWRPASAAGAASEEGAKTPKRGGQFRRNEVANSAKCAAAAVEAMIERISRAPKT